MSKSNQEQMSINPLDIYKQPRKPDDLNLVTIVSLHIKALSDDQQVALFLNNADIATISEANPTVQRIIINRYLTNKLLIFRSKSDVNIFDALPYIANDGYIEDWVKLMSDIVLPFFIRNNIFVKTI